MNDFQAWNAFPNDRLWYNKYFLAKFLGYNCGTIISPNYTSIIRPRINLYGCGLNARVVEQSTTVNQDEFWCEFFNGRHLTIDYHRIGGKWIQKATFEGFNNKHNLQQFTGWKRVLDVVDIPPFITRVESDFVNIETVAGKVIEIHLRTNPDPIDYDHFIPVWKSAQIRPDGYQYIPENSKANHLNRLGFYVK